jgi:hypothetical protein
MRQRTSGSNIPRIATGLFLVFVSAWSLTAVAATSAGNVVIEYYHPGLDHFFITSDPAEQAAVDSGAAGPFQRTGNSFAAGGPNAVCRFYGSQSPGPNSHFYTADAGECADLKRIQGVTPASQKRWNFESNDFATTSAVNGACAAGLLPVYRAYNNGFTRGVDSNHRITSNFVAYQQTVAAGWKAEGVVMCAPPSASITISGLARFESVPTDPATGKLLYSNAVTKPVRGASVQVVSAVGGIVLATGTTSSTGTYSLSIPAPQPVFMRVRAEMKKTAGPGGTWDFTVRDNTQGDALYALDTATFTPTIGANTLNLLAGSGWGGAGYTGARSAGALAILDVVYDASQKVLAASPNVAFPPLQLMWSVNNRPTGGDRAAGLIGTSHFSSSTSAGRRIYILGAADSDTDEYDRPVVAHEFGHYLQEAFARDDSIGGSHSGGDLLDMRVAFSEGWGNAWAGMALNTQYYTDSSGVGQGSGFRVDLAARPASKNGWYNERSVQYLMYQWHANPAIGFTPIFNVLASMPVTLPAIGAVSSIHSFAHYLKLQVPGQIAAINSLLNLEQITVTNALGTGETNSGGNADALPVYRAHSAPLGQTQNYCLNDDSSALGGYEPNKLGANLFIRFTLAASGTRSINVVSTNAVAADPDFTLYRTDGAKIDFEASGGVSESTGNISLAAGTHLIVLEDYALTRGEDSADNNGRRCFNVTIN